MIGIGILTILLGFVIALISLGMTSNVNGRMVMALIGLAVSLFGIMGLINPAFNKKATWRK